MDPIFNTQGMRPVVGTEFLLSRHLPKEVQGQFVYACVINMNGIPRFSVYDESAGFRGHRLMHSAGSEDPRTTGLGDPRTTVGGNGNGRELPDDLIASTDKNFRPVDPQIGPDGALWFGDWCNALIGHMQYSQRDPSRDHTRGRVYRLVYKGRPLVEPVTQHGKSELELLQQLREYEPRTRYRARRELYDRPAEAVRAAVTEWVSELKPSDPHYDRLRCEALWALQSHHIVDEELLRGVLSAKSPNARAAATHLVADERDFLPAALELLTARVRDDNPRVRLEAIRGLSFFPTMAAVDAALEVLNYPMDDWLDYTLEHTLCALEPVWGEAYRAGTLAAGNERAREFIAEYLARRRPGLVAEGHLKVLLNPESSDTARLRGLVALENLRGSDNNGEAVFRRVCASCHRADNFGYEFGPNLSDAGKRLTRRDLIESIIDPSKKVDPKYVTTTVTTVEGKVELGLVIKKTDESITLLTSEGKQKEIALNDIDEMEETNQSSMPENLASTLAPAEFLDVVEFLTEQKE
jgi:putative heme-binding domain-containing protein